MSDTNKELARVIEQEKRLQFDSFDNEMAWEIAKKVIDRVKSQGLKSVGIRIVYQDQVILHYLMKEKKASNWLDRKVNTVLQSQHSSLFTFYSDAYEKWQEDATYAICGGGFPILEKGKVTGVIAVSGLEHTVDHQLIVTVLEEYLNQPAAKSSEIVDREKKVGEE